MACKKCELIADDIGCEGCANDIVEDCEGGDCWAERIIERGSCNGHHLSVEVIKKIKSYADKN